MDGGLSEYVLAVASHVIPIPSSVSFVQAAPILCKFDALQLPVIHLIILKVPE